VSEGLTIREVARRTGVEAPTLRMWEQRHGFPEPDRRPSGHRRYSEEEVELIFQVLRDREAGLELRPSIENAKRARGAPARVQTDGESIYAGLRRRRPDLLPYLQEKRTLLGLSQAIEDECSARAERAVLIASFQRESFYRQAEARWRDLAAPAEAAVVMADFPRVRRRKHAPTEVPIDRADPIGREWSVICEAPGFTTLLAAWERPGQDGAPDCERVFETVWSVEPELVRAAALVAVGIIERGAPKVAAELSSHLDRPLGAPGIPALQSLTNRMVAYVGGAKPQARPSGD